MVLPGGRQLERGKKAGGIIFTIQVLVNLVYDSVTQTPGGIRWQFIRIRDSIQLSKTIQDHQLAGTRGALFSSGRQ